MENTNRSIFENLAYIKFISCYRYTREQLINLSNTLECHMAFIKSEVEKLKLLIDNCNNYEDQEISTFLKRYRCSLGPHCNRSECETLLDNFESIQQFYFWILNHNENDLYIDRTLIIRILNIMERVVYSYNECNSYSNSLFTSRTIGQMILGIMNNVMINGSVNCILNNMDMIINGEAIPKTRFIAHVGGRIVAFDEIDLYCSKMKIAIYKISNLLIITDSLEVGDKILFRRHENSNCPTSLLSLTYRPISFQSLKGLPMRAIFDHTDISEVNKELSTECCKQPCYESSVEDIDDIVRALIFVNKEDEGSGYKFYLCAKY